MVYCEQSGLTPLLQLQDVVRTLNQKDLVEVG